MTDLLALDSFSLLEQSCTNAAGVLLVPSRPGTRGAGVVLRDILTALGKDAAGCRAVAEHAGLSELTLVWLRAERISTVVLHAADRVAARALHVAQSLLVEAGIQVVALRRDDSLPDLGPTSDEALVSPPAELAHLSRAVQPYFAAAGLFDALIGSWDGLDEVVLADLDPEALTVQVSGTKVAIPAGAWRYIEAQRLHSAAHGRAELFTMFGRPLDRSVIAYGAIKALTL